MPEIGQEHGNTSEKISGYDTEKIYPNGTILFPGSFLPINQQYDWSLWLSVLAGWHRSPLFIDEDTNRQGSEARQNLIRVSETVSQFYPELGKPISQIHLAYFASLGSPWWLCGKESACSVGVVGSITGSGRFPGGGNGNPLQYSYLENSTDRGAWQATGAFAQSSLCAKEPLRPCKESDTTEWLN